MKHRCALNVLKSIAKKAGGSAVAEMQYGATKRISHARTTRRENFLPFFSFAKLLDTAKVINEGIQLFSKKGCKQEKTSWMDTNTYKKRKRE